jgi:hypothetical protein
MTHFAVLIPVAKANRLRLRDHRRVDADHPALGVDQRPAGISRIERGIGLNHIVHEPAGGGPQSAAERGNHARGHGLRVAERIADGDGHLSHLQGGGIAELHIGQRGGRADAQHRQVRVRIVADQVSAEAGVVVQAHRNLIGALDHVAVGQQIAVGREQKARTAAARRSALPAAGRAVRRGSLR